MDIYTWADNCIDSSLRYETGFTELLASGPYEMTAAARRLYAPRHACIRAYQKIGLEIFRAALRGETHPAVLHWLLNETPVTLGVGYHCGLEGRHFTVPLFFRTDEVTPGKIAEIQCPGSLWGELQLVHEHAAAMGYCDGEASPAHQFAAQLHDYLQTTSIVHHLLDNASAPAGMRYFIAKTRPGVKYWGIDQGVTVGDCNFIRSHSFFGLCSENEFAARLARVGNGVTYDLPPHVLFDQKAALVLPFWSLTRGLYTDEIRDFLLFSTPLLPTGIETPDGRCISIEEFCHWPRSHRSYYLKYAGSSVALNWGSKAVYRLSNLSSDACLKLMQQCLSSYEQGHIWLLQEEGGQDDEISYLTRDGAVHTACLRAKFSGFYGPDGCIGVLAMHRHHNKVHGQADTVLSYVAAGNRLSVSPANL